ncbi:ABC transporter substrate-binding protein [Metabacillus sediminilitoris]|uniref:Extracellular solute-binding protein n=1 Tax=Metabacillus sediminilitoris TaxID=2567941 RepID=A0A4S4BSZ1_9BACI|nr:ABC transporter substrate-binding protein [Metabacillus sediminilitoris]QGQ44219.1 extracellular solute-binding protein [Metabacillus sediminilitoris]THF78183.1 extracellular solute-binding protein [Metabacillus sediminilitoris]
MKIIKKTLTFMFILLLLAACSSNTETTGTANNENESEEQTTIEGNLSFYTSQPDEDAQKLVDSFTEKYPDVKIEIFRSGTEEVVSKILAENKAGEVQADVLLVADAVTYENLKNEDLLLSYKSEEANEIPESFVDKDGMYTGTKVMATVLAVNTEKVKELPDSWNVLASEAAKGQAVMPSPLYSGAAAYNLGVFTRNGEFNWDFYEGLKKNEVMITEGNGAVQQAVAAGEKSYGMIVDYLVARAKADGSPIDLIYPKEGVPVITEPIAIMKNTKNEAAAKAFVDFVLSEEGQQLAAEIGYTPIRNGIDAPEGLKTIEEMNVLEADLSELYEARESDKEEFSNLFGDK